MEVEEIQATQPCKFPRISSNGRITSDSNKLGLGGGVQQDEDQDDAAEAKRDNSNSLSTIRPNGGVGGATVDFNGGGGGSTSRFYGWPSSRIVRVSRASGGKDRHSKVWTSKGLRDRRVRLSVNTAIQFYDLQDRLGCDQPSKAVEWLLKAAATSIAELPPINTSFPDTPKQLSNEKRSGVSTDHHQHHNPQQQQQHQQVGFDPNEVDMDGDLTYNHHHHHQQQGTLSKSACSSNSETSKGSGLSLSRSESRPKSENRMKAARERARERAAEKKEKEKETDPFCNSNRVVSPHHQDVTNNPISHNNSSFTELLTGGINGGTNNSTNNTTTSPSGGSGNGTPNESNFFQRSPRQWNSSTPMDYFATGLLGLSSTRAATPHNSSTGFSGQIHLGNPLVQQPLTSVSSPLFSIGGDHHPELQFSFVPDHLVPVVTASAAAAAAAANNNSSSNNNDNHGHDHYNLNFTISSTSGLAGFNRGTLQSNSSSPSLLPHNNNIQRFSPIDGSSSSFFLGATHPTAAAAAVENHHHHLFPGFDARLQLCYGDGHGHNGRHSDQKGKGKN